jgi:leukotriene-A4 hydrolase
MSLQTKDQATLSNYHEVRNLHTHLDWTIDWKEQLIGGTATLTMKPETDKPVEKVVLDTSYLDVFGVKVDGEKVEVCHS